METDVVVIGAGATGLFTALDLSYRGASVVLVDRGALLNGTSGRYHGLLHSGARYVTNDLPAAIECREESEVISKMAPFAIVNEGGLFVRLKGEDDSFTDRFLKGLTNAGINYNEVSLSELKDMEPNLSPDLDFAVSVPDKVLDPFKLFYSIAVVAKNNGAKFLLNSEVVGFEEKTGTVKTTRGDIKAKAVVNAAGPWAGKVLHIYGNELNMMPAIGLMLVYNQRIIDHVINRMRPPSDGDIILPFYGESILGTTAQFVEDLDEVEISQDDIQLLIDEGSKMVPSLIKRKYSRMYFSARPLMAGADARAVSRDFEIVGNDWIISIFGGKLTTSRLMAEKVSNLVSSKLNIKTEGSTKNLVLPPIAQPKLAYGTIGEDIYSAGLWLADMIRVISI